MFDVMGALSVAHGRALVSSLFFVIVMGHVCYFGGIQFSLPGHLSPGVIERHFQHDLSQLRLKSEQLRVMHEVFALLLPCLQLHRQGVVCKSHQHQLDSVPLLLLFMVGELFCWASGWFYSWQRLLEGECV